MNLRGVRSVGRNLILLISRVLNCVFVTPISWSGALRANACAFIGNCSYIEPERAFELLFAWIKGLSEGSFGA